MVANGWRRAVVWSLALVTLVGIGLVATSSRDLARAGASTPGISCAHIAPVPKVTTASATLDGYVATYVGVSDSTTTVPTPGVGLPFPGTLKVVKGSTTWRLRRPAGFAGAAVVRLCLVYPSSGASPAVLLGAYSGGAHCCFLTALYARPVPGDYQLILNENLHFGKPAIAYDANQGLVAKDVGSMTLLEGADGTFAYRFGCYACTPTPIHFFSIEGARVVDVSRHFATAIAANAATLWQAVVANEKAKSGYQGLFGSLAAWTAEQCTIGRGAQAWKTVLSLQSSGVLNDARYHRVAFVKHGSFVPHLRSFLMTGGYCRQFLASAPVS